MLAKASRFIWVGRRQRALHAVLHFCHKPTQTVASLWRIWVGVDASQQMPALLLLGTRPCEVFYAVIILMQGSFKHKNMCRLRWATWLVSHWDEYVRQSSSAVHISTSSVAAPGVFSCEDHS